jgi:hypothetical protein
MGHLQFKASIGTRDHYISWAKVPRYMRWTKAIGDVEFILDTVTPGYCLLGSNSYKKLIRNAITNKKALSPFEPSA